MSGLFANIGRIIDLLPILLFILLALKGKAGINKGLWVIFFYCVVVALNDNILFKYIPEDRFHIVFSSFTLIEYLSFSLFLWLNTENARFRRLLAAFSAFFALFIVLYFIIVPFNFIDSVPIGIETILVIGLSVYFLFEQVNKTTILLYNTAGFWIITGFLIYLAGSLFIYLYASQVEIDELYKFFYVTYIFTSLKNIFISIAFWVQYRQPKIQHTHEFQPYLN